MEIKKNNRGEYVEVTLALPRGLHARPSARLAQLARLFKADIMIIHENGEVDAKSMLDLLSIAAQHGDRLIILANGPDASEALASIATFCGNSKDEYGPADS